MSVYKRNDAWWYSFIFAGQRIQASAKSSSKTAAKEAEKIKRRELEDAINGLKSAISNRILTIKEKPEDCLADYRLRFRSVKFAEYAVGHIVRLLGEKMVVQIGEDEVVAYQGDPPTIFPFHLVPFFGFGSKVSQLPFVAKSQLESNQLGEAI